MTNQLFREKKIVMSLKIDETLKRKFQLLCEIDETTPSQEIRKFIREFIQKREQTELDFGD